MKERYLNAVNQTGFVLDDLTLYLDTHPMDQEALAYYQTARAQYEMAAANYCQNVGPLFHKDAECNGHFSWLTDKWPWEGGCD